MDFIQLNTTALDKDLSEEQRAEWNAIYASYRSKSILSGYVIGMDTVYMTVRNGQSGRNRRVEVNCLVIIAYRVKILIPEQEIWYSTETRRPPHVLRSMAGAGIEYVITQIDREGDCCLASRRMALEVRRKQFRRHGPKEGDVVPIRVIATGPTRLLAEYGGFDASLTQRDLSYAMIADVREKYHPGMILHALYKGYDKEKDTVVLSVKESEPHPFIGADMRHPVGCRRASIITGKHKGGVFCRLEEHLDVLCTYSQHQYDGNFHIGDSVIVAITKHDYMRSLVYGKIVAKW